MSMSWYQPREPSVDRMYRPRPERAMQLPLEDVDEQECDSDSSSDSKLSEVTGSSSSINSYATTQTNNITTANLTTYSSASNTTETANVFLRLRPFRNDQYTEWKDMKVQNDQVLTVSSQAVAQRREMEKSHTFTGIFDQHDGQRIIYQHSVKKLFESDRDAVILTYGTSGSGKTYTMLGTSEAPGIVPRSLYSIFGRFKNNIQHTPVVKTAAGKLDFLTDSEIEKEKRDSLEFLKTAAQIETTYDVRSMLDRIEEEEEVVAEPLGSTKVYVWVSFMEIYNERVFDLLVPPQGADNGRAIAANGERRKELKVVQDGESTMVRNLRQIFVRSCEDVMRILSYGMHQVTSGSTQINARSSRSHCIISVDVITETPAHGFSFTKYKFGDLAGTERLKKTENVGNRLKEAQHINTSLLALSRCLDVLQMNGTRKKKELVPFRDSKLTMLIKAALKGIDNFVMIVNMLPALEFLDENLHVLNFASIAKQLTMKPCAEVMRRQRKQRLSKVHSYLGAESIGISAENALLLDNLTAENYKLRMLLEQSEQQLEQMEIRLEEAETKLERTLEEKRRVVDYYKTYMAKSDASKKKHDKAVEDYHKYQMEKLQARVKELEGQLAAATQNKSDSSGEESDDEEDEQRESGANQSSAFEDASEVIDVESDE